MSCQRFILSVRKLHLSILTTDCEEMQWINGSNAQARHSQQNKNKAFRHRAHPLVPCWFIRTPFFKRNPSWLLLSIVYFSLYALNFECTIFNCRISVFCTSIGVLILIFFKRPWPDWLNPLKDCKTCKHVGQSRLLHNRQAHIITAVYV